MCTGTKRTSPDAVVHVALSAHARWCVLCRDYIICPAYASSPQKTGNFGGRNHTYGSYHEAVKKANYVKKKTCPSVSAGRSPEDSSI